MRRLFSLSFGIPLATLLFLANSQSARAITVTTVECAVAVFPCPAASVIDSGVRTDGVNVLPINTVDAGAFAFANAQIGFAGTVTVSDVNGVLDTLLATGTATEGPTAVADFVDVDIHQNYTTNPLIVGLVGAALEFNIGTCNAAAAAAGSYNQSTLVADGTVLPIMGGPGDCAGGAFAFAGGAPVVITQPVSLDALVQFGFAPSGLLQAIDLPLGEDVAPEPGTFLLMGIALAVFAGIRRRRARR